MSQIFEPWSSAFREFLLRVPEGPKSSALSGELPEELAVPPSIPDEENGFVQFQKHIADWPLERHPAPDLRERLKKLPGEKYAATRAIQKLRPLLDDLDPILEMPHWFAVIHPGDAMPRFRGFTRLGLALLIRAEIDGNPDDIRRVKQLSLHMRRSKGGLDGFYRSLYLEEAAKGDYQGFEEDRVDAVRMELARVIIPALPSVGPWDVRPWRVPADFLEWQRAEQWLLSGHPNPYDANATLKDFLAFRPFMETASSEQLVAAAIAVAKDWPAEMRPRVGKVNRVIPLSAIYSGRRALRAVENPLGASFLAHWLMYMSTAGRWVEFVRKETTPR